MVTVTTHSARLYMPMAELVDLEAERARLTKELEKAKKQLEAQEKKLANENFVSRAPGGRRQRRAVSAPKRRRRSSPTLKIHSQNSADRP